MFTGIIEEIGEITRVQQYGDAARITVRGPLATQGAQHGDSISVSGVCLTVVALERDEFTADVMRETLEMSTLDKAGIGTHVNLERAARLGDRLGGHLVQGHVDGTAVVLSTTDGSAWRVVRLSLTPELAPLVARKGSIAIDGTSLTVSAVGGGALEGYWFEVSLIPETLAATTLGQRVPGDLVNLETDIVARQVERMLEFRAFDEGARWPDDTGTSVAHAIGFQPDEGARA
ncbi:riboflavin synthase [Gryllotalpicola kribbensis]|uniref:Riboflavin synthase n=1 Tax=Gryllotalpicola kribbensis TaxID=993084 RepID=A0ABP8AQH4_9MICO